MWPFRKSSYHYLVGYATSKGFGRIEIALNDGPWREGTTSKVEELIAKSENSVGKVVVLCFTRIKQG